MPCVVSYAVPCTPVTVTKEWVSPMQVVSLHPWIKSSPAAFALPKPYLPHLSVSTLNFLLTTSELKSPPPLSYKSSFIPTKCNLWNVLPSCFPKSHNLPSFRSKINKLDLISLNSQPFAFFFPPLLGLCIGHHGLSPT